MRHDSFYLLYCCKILAEMAIWILSEKRSAGIFRTVFRRLADGYGNWWCNYSDKEAKLIAQNYHGLMFSNQFAWNSLYCPQIKHDYTSSMKSVELFVSENVLVTLWKFCRKYPNSVRLEKLEAVECQILKPQDLHNVYRDFKADYMP